MITPREARPHHRRRTRLTAALLMLAATALLGCGGGSPSASESEASPQAAASAQVYPAIGGLVLVEYDESGQELQRSAASDSQGRAIFWRPLRGARIRSIDFTSSLAVATNTGGRFSGSPTELELTPLTAHYDQLLALGQSPAAARAQTERLVAGACGSTAAAEAVTALHAHTPHSGSTRAPVLMSLDAMTRALHLTGMSPATPGLDWHQKLEQHLPVFTRMCRLTQEALQPGWLAQLGALASAADPKHRAPEVTLLTGARQHALGQILRLMGSELPVLEQPELASVMETDRFSWRGSEPTLLQQLAQTQYLADLDSQLTKAAAGQPRAVAYTLQADGQLSGAMAATAVPQDDQPAKLRLSSTATEDRHVRVTINGVEMGNLQGLVDQILAMPLAHANEPLYERAWRFVTLWNEHKAPITPGRLQHQADLYFRSIGQGYCDDVASVLKALWAHLGYESRVMALNGHVVPEVKVNGRWLLYDPDLGVYYRRRDQLIAGVQDITADTTLVTSPEERVAAFDDWPYSQVVADTYADPQRIAVSDWLNEAPLAPLTHQFTVPRGGYLEFVRAVTGVMDSVVPSESPVNLAEIQLWVPPGYTGTIELPLVLMAVSGDATVTLQGQRLESASGAATAALETYYMTDGDAGVQRIDVHRIGPGGLMLKLAANPKYFFLSAQLQVRVVSSNINGLKFSPANQAS